MKGLMRFEDTLYYVDLESFEFKVVEPDGTVRPWLIKGDADLFEVLERGIIVGDSLPEGKK